jgi:hypothetical protein
MRAGSDTADTRKHTEKAVAIGETIGTIPWIRALVLAISKSNAALESSLAAAETRKAHGAATRDLFHYLVRFSSPPRAAPADSAPAR